MLSTRPQEITAEHPLEQALILLINDEFISDLDKRQQALRGILAEISEQRQRSIQVLQQLTQAFPDSKLGSILTESFRPDINARDKTSGDTPLTAAAKLNDVSTMKLLIAAGADRNFQNKDSNTALMEATAHSHVEALHYLIELENIDLKPIKLSSGDTLLHIAVRANFSDGILLIRSKVNIETQNHANQTALTLAAGLGFDVCVQELLDAGAKTGLKNIPDAAAAEYLRHKNVFNFAPALRDAILNKHSACAYKILSTGFDLSFVNHFLAEINELRERSRYVFDCSLPHLAENRIDFSLFQNGDKAKNMLSIIFFLLSNSPILKIIRKEIHYRTWTPLIEFVSDCKQYFGSTKEIGLLNCLLDSNSSNIKNNLLAQTSILNEANIALGEVYEDECNYRLALQYYEIAFDAGNLYAKNKLEDLAARLQGTRDGCDIMSMPEDFVIENNISLLPGISRFAYVLVNDKFYLLNKTSNDFKEVFDEAEISVLREIPLSTEARKLTDYEIRKLNLVGGGHPREDFQHGFDLVFANNKFSKANLRKIPGNSRYVFLLEQTVNGYYSWDIKPWESSLKLFFVDKCKLEYFSYYKAYQDYAAPSKKVADTFNITPLNKDEKFRFIKTLTPEDRETIKAISEHSSVLKIAEPDEWHLTDAAILAENYFPGKPVLSLTIDDESMADKDEMLDENSTSEDKTPAILQTICENIQKRIAELQSNYYLFSNKHKKLVFSKLKDTLQNLLAGKIADTFSSEKTIGNFIKSFLEHETIEGQKAMDILGVALGLPTKPQSLLFVEGLIREYRYHPLPAHLVRPKHENISKPGGM